MIERNRRGGLLLAVLSFLMVATVACSSSSPPTATTGSDSPPAPVATSPPASSPPSGGSSDSALSGTWTGHYGGDYTGTFKLEWQQSGSKLSGTIKLSNENDPVPLTGIVSGTTIKFGTVGSQVITYTGTVSGDSMSGTYKVHTSGGTLGGPWSATKTS